MNPILLARHVQESLRELVHTTLNSSSRAFEGMVDRFLDDPAHFIKGPWLSVDMPFRQIDGAVDGTWTQPFPEIPLRFAPYQHQMDAFARLSGTFDRSLAQAMAPGRNPSLKSHCVLRPTNTRWTPSPVSVAR